MTSHGVRLGEIDTVIGPIQSLEGVALKDRHINSLKALWEAKERTTEAMLQIGDFGRTLSETDFECFWRTLVMDQDIRNMANPITPAPEEFATLSRMSLGLDE